MVVGEADSGQVPELPVSKVDEASREWRLQASTYQQAEVASQSNAGDSVPA
jgi:hypothetical protein